MDVWWDSCLETVQRCSSYTVREEGLAPIIWHSGFEQQQGSSLRTLIIFSTLFFEVITETSLIIEYVYQGEIQSPSFSVNIFHIILWSQVPVAAAVYYEDMYVNFKLSKETASQIAGIRLWITNEFMHSGLRDDGGKVLDHLLGMLNGKKPLFWSPLLLFSPSPTNVLCPSVA